MLLDSNSNTLYEDLIRYDNDNDDNYKNVYDINCNNKPVDYWSPSNNLILLFNKNNASNMNYDDFQQFVKNLVSKKCWKYQDVINFIRINNELNVMMNTTNNHNWELLTDSNFCNNLSKLSDYLDTINAVCAIDGKCDIIKDSTNRDEIVKQIIVLGFFLDLYAPVIARLIIVLENDLDNVGKKYNIDQETLNTVQNMKQNLVKSVITRASMPSKNNNKIDSANSENNIGNINTINNNVSNANIIKKCPKINMLHVVIIVLIIGILIYIGYNSFHKKK